VLTDKQVDNLKKYLEAEHELWLTRIQELEEGGIAQASCDGRVCGLAVALAAIRNVENGCELYVKGS
jgi:hypothetical protein